MSSSRWNSFGLANGALIAQKLGRIRALSLTDLRPSTTCPCKAHTEALAVLACWRKAHMEAPVTRAGWRMACMEAPVTRASGRAQRQALLLDKAAAVQEICWHWLPSG